MNDGFQVRSATRDDLPFLVDMLVEAVNWLPEREVSRQTVSASPELAHYVEGWPGPEDLGVVAEADGQPIAAAWLRHFTACNPGYGYVADDIPELSMAVVAPWRGRGVGRTLLREIIDRARSAGVPAISLSVERANFAYQLYVSEGYQLVERSRDADTLIKHLGQD